MTGYAVRHARADEHGRWKVCRDGFPQDVRGTASTRWGARRMAKRWARMTARSRHVERV